jgi:hypothetical protein
MLNNDNKSRRFTDKVQVRLEKQRIDRSESLSLKYSNKRDLKPYKALYNLLLNRYDRKDIEELYEILNISHHWSFITIPKGKENDKVFLSSLHLLSYKNLFMCPFDNLPLYIKNSEGFGEKIIAWRFKIGV